MAIEWLLAAVVAIVVTGLAPRTVVSRIGIWIPLWITYMSVIALLDVTVGTPWTLIWVVGAPLSIGIDGVRR